MTALRARPTERLRAVAATLLASREGDLVIHVYGIDYVDRHWHALSSSEQTEVPLQWRSNTTPPYSYPIVSLPLAEVGSQVRAARYSSAIKSAAVGWDPTYKGGREVNMAAWDDTREVVSDVTSLL